MNSSEFTYSQLVGPVPSTQKPDIETGSNVVYPKDTYQEYYGKKEVNIPWGWIIFFVILIGAAVGGFLILNERLGTLQLLGCAMMIFAVVWVQLKPSNSKR